VSPIGSADFYETKNKHFSLKRKMDKTVEMEYLPRVLPSPSCWGRWWGSFIHICQWSVEWYTHQHWPPGGACVPPYGCAVVLGSSRIFTSRDAEQQCNCIKNN